MFKKDQDTLVLMPSSAAYIAKKKINGLCFHNPIIILADIIITIFGHVDNLLFPLFNDIKCGFDSSCGFLLEDNKQMPKHEYTRSSHSDLYVLVCHSCSQDA